MVQDVSGLVMNLGGFTKKSDVPHAQAVNTANARQSRKQQLRSLVQVFVLSGEFRDRTRAAILGFKDNLPFQYEEQRNHGPSREHLMKHALEYAELADLENYQVRKIPDSDNLVEVQVISPSAAEPENVAARERATQYLQQQNLYGWASKALDDGRIDDAAKFKAALELARSFDSSTLADDNYFFRSRLSFLPVSGHSPSVHRRGVCRQAEAPALTPSQPEATA
jgi:hypothetical protein